MPECPQCHRDIQDLRHFQDESVGWRFWTDSSGAPIYDDRETLDTHGDPEYACPACGEVLFYSEDDAIAFLNGTPVPAIFDPPEPVRPPRKKTAWKQKT